LQFIDEVLISVCSGRGGRGCVSFRREKFIPRGGPNGGDGGKGGDVVIKINPAKRTLYDFKFKKDLQAQNGSHGLGSEKTGKNGKSLSLEVPQGTLVYNTDTGELIKDLKDKDDFIIIAKGGKGGLGNKKFATSTNRAPRYAQPGEEGESFNIRLELKLISDVGLIGLPNAGKSTLLSALSSAKPKIADYPFTTLIPYLGVVTPEYGEPFVIADIPGLIEGAHTGVGLGIRFLKHIERTKILVHLIDVSQIDINFPTKSFDTINNELKKYSPSLAEKKQIIVLNKMDIPDTKAYAKAFQDALKINSSYEEPILISAYTRKNLKQLISKIADFFL
jgi:GTPase